MCTLLFLNLGTRWRSLVNFTPRPSYPRGKQTHYSLNTKRLDSPSILSFRPAVGQNRSGRSGEEEKKNFSLPGIEPRTPFFSQTNVLKPQQNNPSILSNSDHICIRYNDQKFHYLPQKNTCFTQQRRPIHIDMAVKNTTIFM